MDQFWRIETNPFLLLMLYRETAEWILLYPPNLLSAVNGQRQKYASSSN